MAVEKVNLNAGDDRARVAYEMAMMMWYNSHDGDQPKTEDQVEFLDLVQNCARAISPVFSYVMGKRPTE